MSTNTDDGTNTNTKFVQVKHPVPREPSAYKPHLHYLQRKKYRSDPDVKPWIVEEVIEEGSCRGTESYDAGADIDEEFAGRFLFEKEVWSEGIHHWRVIVGINAKAFVDPDATHTIITAYCKCHSDDPEEVCDGR